ncbi:MAG TPA: Asp23/Gls24 family envelope stress response protein [Mobilitalea sp.]|nr:Asp23/Gls24 family envelope stress response protein [Mobilitalea sp.]
MVGEVRIADEVVAAIAGLAATEVKGVSDTSGNVTNELAGKLGKKNLSKGVKVLVSPDAVSVDMALTLDYGFGIPETAQQVQEKVKLAIENMTGLQVKEVNIRIAGVNIVKV